MERSPPTASSRTTTSSPCFPTSACRISREGGRAGAAPELSRRRLRHPACKLRARIHSELPERLAQVVLDRARADEQQGGDLSVRVSLGHEARDLRLLWRQLSKGIDGAFASMLAGRFQFDACALGECLHTEVGEEVVRRPQLTACIKASALTSQPLAVEQVSASEIDGSPRSTESVECFEIKLLGPLIFRQERLGARRDPEGPVRPAHPGHLRET